MQNLAVKYGVIYAVISTIATLLLWSTGTMLSMWWANMLVSIVACVLVLRALLKEAKASLYGGTITFGQGFKISFVSMLVATVLLVAFTFLFYSYLYTNWKTDAIEVTIRSMEQYGADQAAIDKRVAAIEGQGIGSQLRNAGIAGVVFGAIFSAIMAAVMKTKQPKEDF